MVLEDVIGDEWLLIDSFEFFVSLLVVILLNNEIVVGINGGMLIVSIMIFLGILMVDVEY